MARWTIELLGTNVNVPFDAYSTVNLTALEYYQPIRQVVEILGIWEDTDGHAVEERSGGVVVEKDGVYDTFEIKLLKVRFDNNKAMINNIDRFLKAQFKFFRIISYDYLARDYEDPDFNYYDPSKVFAVTLVNKSKEHLGKGYYKYTIKFRRKLNAGYL